MKISTTCAILSNLKIKNSLKKWERNRKMAFNLELLKQAILNKEPEIEKKYWINFSENLSKLKKSYIEVDAEFITGLDNFCEGIRKGYAVTSKTPKGYSLGSKWVLILFIETFDSLLSKAYSTQSLLWVELAMARIPLPLVQHFATLSILEVANKLDETSKALESAAITNNRFDKQLIKDAATIGLLSRILFYLNNKLPTFNIDWCEYCFRRAPQNSKHCSVHLPKMKVSNNLYKQGGKIIKNVANNKLIEYFTFIDKCKKNRSIRELFERDIYFSEAGFKGNRSFIPASDEVKLFINETTVGNWQLASKNWDELISYLSSVDKALSKKPSSFNSWIDFLEFARKSLQEDIEKCEHPYWFILELTMANEWLDIERNYLATNQTELKIINLANDGLKAQEIMAKLSLGKSRVYQVINEAKKIR